MSSIQCKWNLPPWLKDPFSSPRLEDVTRLMHPTQLEVPILLKDESVQVMISDDGELTDKEEEEKAVRRLRRKVCLLESKNTSLRNKIVALELKIENQEMRQLMQEGKRVLDQHVAACCKEKYPKLPADNRGSPQYIPAGPSSPEVQVIPDEVEFIQVLGVSDQRTPSRGRPKVIHLC